MKSGSEGGGVPGLLLQLSAVLIHPWFRSFRPNRFVSPQLWTQPFCNCQTLSTASAASAVEAVDLQVLDLELLGTAQERVAIGLALARGAALQVPRQVQGGAACPPAEHEAVVEPVDEHPVLVPRETGARQGRAGRGDLLLLRGLVREIVRFGCNGGNVRCSKRQ